MIVTTEQLTTTHEQRSGQPFTDRWWQRGLAWGLLAVPVLIFGLVWQYYAVNIPKWDDHALRAFLFYFDQEPTLTGKIYQLFRQHNEHRIVYDRLVSALDYQLFGTLNYVHLMLVGNLSLAGLLAVFMAVLHRSRLGLSGQWVIYSLPVAWLLFNLSQWENMFWGMAALQNFSVVLWVLAAFYFLSYTNQWGLAFVAGLLATLTSGNGLMVWPIGFLILALRQPAYSLNGNRRSYGPLIGWLTGAILVVGLYFMGFEKPGGMKYTKPGAAELLKGWLAVVGAAAEALPGRFPLRNSIGLGGILVWMLLGIVLWTLLANRRSVVSAFAGLVRSRSGAGVKPVGAIAPLTLFFWSCAGFILGTAAVVAGARTGAGIDLLITSRYKMYSLTALALLYVYGAASLSTRTARWWLAGTLAGSLVLAGLSYTAFLSETIWWRHWNIRNQFNWTHSSNSPVFTLDSVSQQYTPPVPAFYDKVLPILYGPARQAPIHLQLTKTEDVFSVANTTQPARGLGRDAGAYLLARSAKRSYLFPVWQNHQSILAARFIPQDLFIPGFRASLSSAELDAGAYQLFVVTVSDQGVGELHPTGQTIVSTGPPPTVTAKNW